MLLLAYFLYFINSVQVYHKSDQNLSDGLGVATCRHIKGENETGRGGVTTVLKMHLRPHLNVHGQ